MCTFDADTFLRALFYHGEFYYYFLIKLNQLVLNRMNFRLMLMTKNVFTTELKLERK